MTIVVALLTAWPLAASGGLGVPSSQARSPEAAALALPPGRSVDAAAVASTVREALRTGEYPWYDAESGKLRPVLPAKPPWSKRLGELLDKASRPLRRALDAFARFLSRLSPGRGPGLAASGSFLMTVLLWVALIGLVLALVRLWYRRTELASAAARNRLEPGRGSLLAELAGAKRQSNVDPWSEAVRRRDAGDLAGALVYLFVHQLLGLDQVGMIQLAPGVTGRQYVSSLRDADLRRSLGATLGLFEEVHYGHRRPSAAAFEAAWRRALAFRRDVLGQSDEK